MGYIGTCPTKKFGKYTVLKGEIHTVDTNVDANSKQRIAKLRHSERKMDRERVRKREDWEGEAEREREERWLKGERGRERGWGK